MPFARDLHVLETALLDPQLDDPVAHALIREIGAGRGVAVIDVQARDRVARRHQILGRQPAPD